MDLPVQQIVYMLQQGASDEQIAGYLAQSGYDPQSISVALNQAHSRLGGQTMEPSFTSGTHSGPNKETEELIETIINEKWQDVSKNIDKMLEWKDKVDQRIVKIETQFSELKDQFESLHTGILGKISEYDATVKDVGTEVAALEKVFSKILPTFTENVNELSRLTKDLKPSRPNIPK